jgi:hypothetical protein
VSESYLIINITLTCFLCRRGERFVWKRECGILKRQKKILVGIVAVHAFLFLVFLVLGSLPTHRCADDVSIAIDMYFVLAL